MKVYAALVGRARSIPPFACATRELRLGCPPPLRVAVYVCVVRVIGGSSSGPEAMLALFAQVVLARSAAALNCLLACVC